MNIFIITILFVCLSSFASAAGPIRFRKIGVNKQEVCQIKRSCVTCLELNHCSWCSKEKKCFSSQLASELCKNESIPYINYGFSFKENAECGCAPKDSIIEDCVDNSEVDAVPCNGRGKCICGKCKCDAPSDEHPTKVVLGKYCEFDNYSCDGPTCNEGIYFRMESGNANKK